MNTTPPVTVPKQHPKQPRCNIIGCTSRAVHVGLCRHHIRQLREATP